MPIFVVTANRLRDGIVVWSGPGYRWVEMLADAALFDEKSVEPALEAAVASEKRHEVVAPYKTGAGLIDGRLVPDTGREQIRALGPTVRRDLGPQAAAHTAASGA